MMQVDFYLRQEESALQCYPFICRLVEKAYQRNHSLYVLCEDTQQQQRLDELLWTFRDDSFIPHALLTPDTPASVPIILGNPEDTPPSMDILLNLCHEAPPCFSTFSRTLDIVINNAANKEHARKRYRYYREQGATLKTNT